MAPAKRGTCRTCFYRTTREHYGNFIPVCLHTGKDIKLDDECPIVDPDSAEITYEQSETAVDHNGDPIVWKITRARVAYRRNR